VITSGKPVRMRFAVDGWDPTYGTSLEVENDIGEAQVRVDVEAECDLARWSPISPMPVELPEATVFVDGVRRIEARIWIDNVQTASDAPPSTEASAALCASYAAGSICCCGEGAHLFTSEARRGLFTTAPHAADINTEAAVYAAFHTAPNEKRSLATTLSAALQHQLLELERTGAVKARAALSAHGIGDQRDLLVVDGPIRGRAELPRALGFIKSHQKAYLAPALHAIVGRLAAGERTPVFLVGTSWDRYSWYLRLPCLPGQPWAGIARVECAPNLSVDQVVELANVSQAVLPRFASAEYKDPRAPQNLYPVAGLEKELRRRLGDSALLYRALRRSAVRS
jgi:hypothetical protein